MEKRKIVQISVSEEDESVTIAALCNDGSVWVMINNKSWNLWSTSNEIPQTDFGDESQ